ncbi:unnamed protein product [Mytilus coruscus]|uniref:Uncharacterized protein n=1 Tax=Mytilus coruscus TaxID=42192 RepID=A0A6J8A6R9_MYTCO|nr:unnamed protein product [Mytilus coruscus]
MRNHLAAEVLNTDMLYLMKCYQSTLENPESLASTVEILENSSILVDIFLDKRPINNLQDPRLQKLKNVLLFFNKWEKEIEHCKLYSASKNLITFQIREDLNSSIQGFLSLCEQHVGNGNGMNPGYINSDIIENNFCQLRGIRNSLNTNPTLAQIGPSQTAVCLGQTTLSSKCNTGGSASYFKATTPCAVNPSQNKKKEIRQTY